MSRGLAIGLGMLGLGVLALAALDDGGVVQKLQGQVGRFFSWRELTSSGAAARLGLDNTPPAEAQERLRQLVEVVLDPVRAAHGRPVRVTSGYRTSAANRAVGGSTTSQHMRGEAVDIKADGLSAVMLATLVIKVGVPFDQLIWYDDERGGHVHVSFTSTGKNRGETLHAPASGGYRPWRPANVA